MFEDMLVNLDNSDYDKKQNGNCEDGEYCKHITADDGEHAIVLLCTYEARFDGKQQEAHH